MVVLIKGRISLKEETPKLIANDANFIDNVYKSISAINIELDRTNDRILVALKEKLKHHPGKIPVYLHVVDTQSLKRAQILVGEEFYVEPRETLIKDLVDTLGEAKFSLTL